jgi:hypothetical protein
LYPVPPFFSGLLQNNPRPMQACRHIGRKPKPVMQTLEFTRLAL